MAQKVHTPIHDHTFIFESTVLLGWLAHETFQVDPCALDEATHVIFNVSGPNLVSSGTPVKVKRDEILVLAPGQAYRFGGPGWYHDSHGQGLVATVMRKVWVDLAASPTVLVPVGVEPDNDFRRDQYPEETLLPFVQKVLDQVPQRLEGLFR